MLISISESVFKFKENRKCLTRVERQIVSLSLGDPKLRARQEKIEGSLNSKVSFDTVCRVLRKTNNLYGRIARTNIINQNLIGIEG